MKPFASLRPGPVHQLFRLTPYLLLLTLLFAPSLFAQWLPDMRLSFNDKLSKTSYTNTRCVAVQGNAVHVVWYDERNKGPLDSNTEIYYKRSTDYGLTWGLETRLTNDIALSDNPTVAVSGNFVHVIWEDQRSNPGSGIYYKRSTDWGATWGTDTWLTGYPGGMAPLSLAVSGSNVHIVWQYQASQTYSKSSTNNGTTWGNDVPVAPNPSAEWGPSVAVSPSGVVHATWHDNRNAGVWEIYYARSTDHGASWQVRPGPLSAKDEAFSYGSSITASGSNVNAVWWDQRHGNYEIYSNRSTDDGANWGTTDTRLTYNANCLDVYGYPSIAASGSNVHLVWHDARDGANGEIYYKTSTDNGATWDYYNDTRLTENSAYSGYPSVVASNGGIASLVWTDNRDGNQEIYFKQGGGQSEGRGGFPGLLTEPSQGRHLVRDPLTGTLHLVMHTEGATPKVFYASSTDGGFKWATLQYLGDGKYPTIGLAFPPEYPQQAVPCVAYQPYPTSNYLKYKYLPPGTGGWQDGTIPTPNNPGPPSLVAVGNAETPGSRVYVAFRAGTGYVYCQNFNYNTPSSYVRDLMDNTPTHTNCSQPCLAVDGNGMVYGAWRWVTNNEVWYGRRGSPPTYWSSKLRVDWTTDPSQQPFVECYGDSVYVAWSDGQPSPSEVWRAAKGLTDLAWYQRINVSNSSNPSESPIQAWREFTTWSEGTSDEPPMMFDINYWRPSGMTGVVMSNPAEWSYWTHSQMSYFEPDLFTHLWSAWTESPNPGQPPYRVLFKHTSFPFFGPGLGGELSDYGNYYKVLAGQDSASRYCRKRDGVMRFGEKAVDFSRDSLVYELPYLDPTYDYYVRVASYRETGEDWVQGLSVDGGAARTVRFTPNLVDTVWVRIPLEAYEQDRNVSFSLKNLRGDYVTGLSLTLFQRDPKRGKGGPQAGEPVTQPVMQEVFAVYPDPSKGQVQIEYNLKAPSAVRLGIYDMTGRLVREVVNGAQPAGVHKATWDGKNVNGHQAPSGIYFLKLNSPGVNKTARFVVIR